MPCGPERRTFQLLLAPSYLTFCGLGMRKPACGLGMCKPAPQACTLPLRGDRRLAHKRRNAQRRNPVLLAAQDAKAETMKGESLPGLRDRARLVNHQARDGGCLSVGQAPVHRPVEVADRHPTVDIDRAVG